jgi:hypothetical protein
VINSEKKLTGAIKYTGIPKKVKHHCYNAREFLAFVSAEKMNRGLHQRALFTLRLTVSVEQIKDLAGGPYAPSRDIDIAGRMRQHDLRK